MTSFPAQMLVTRCDFLQNVSHGRSAEIASEFYNKRQTALFIITSWHRRPRDNKIVKSFFEFYSQFLGHTSMIFQKCYDLFMQNFEFVPGIVRMLIFSDGATSHFFNSSNLLWGSNFYQTYDILLEWAVDPPYHGKGSCDSRGAVIKRGLRFWVLTPGQDVADVQQLTDYTNNNHHINAPGTSFRVDVNENDVYDHAKTVAGISKFHHFHFVSPSVVDMRKWPCYCDSCLRCDWRHCANRRLVGRFYRKNITFDGVIAPKEKYLRRARMYGDIPLVPSYHSGSSDVEWEVEKIIAMRTSNGVSSFLVKWQGFESRWNEWLSTDYLRSPTELQLVQNFLLNL